MARAAQPVPALRRGTTVCRLEGSRALFRVRLVFSRNPGDTWAFTIIGDRIPIAVIIIAIYFGVVRAHPVMGAVVVVVAVALLIWTAPNRWGVGTPCIICLECIGPIPRILSRRREPGGNSPSRCRLTFKKPPS